MSFLVLGKPQFVERFKYLSYPTQDMTLKEYWNMNKAHLINAILIIVFLIATSWAYIASGGEDVVLYLYIGILVFASVTSFILTFFFKEVMKVYWIVYVTIIGIILLNIVYGITTNIGTDSAGSIAFMHIFYGLAIIIFQLISIYFAKGIVTVVRYFSK